jgi:RNA polymerase sigma-70 factor, ECF subfamily
MPMSRGDLAALVDAAARARPGLDRHAFAEHIAATAPEDGELAVADLALAFQAVQGDQAAVAELYATVERAARPALTVAGYAATLADDAIQETATRLLVGPVGDDAKPLLLTYQGRARLTLWIKTIALRTAARLVEITRRVNGDDAMLGELAGSQDPASAVVKAELRPAVRAAFAAAVKKLSYVDRELLASVIVRGETIDQLSRRHEVHRATAARWVGRARAALDDGLRRELASALELSASEVSSVLSAIATSIELTPGRLADAKQRPRRQPR